MQSTLNDHAQYITWLKGRDLHTLIDVRYNTRRFNVAGPTEALTWATRQRRFNVGDSAEAVYRGRANRRFNMAGPTEALTWATRQRRFNVGDSTEVV